MDTTELSQHIHNLRLIGSDTQAIEVKAAKGGLPNSIMETVCAFVNDGGGLIILGLDEKDAFKPVAIDTKKLVDAFKSRCEHDLNIALHPQIDLLPFEGHTLVVAEFPALPEQEKPCYIASRGGVYQNAYIRTSDGDHKLSPYEVDRLLEAHKRPLWDVEPVHEARLDDLDESLVNALVLEEQKNHPKIFSGSTIKTLRMLRILAPARDGEKDDSAAVPTLAGLLALGTYPQYYFPQLAVTCVAYAGATKAGDLSGPRMLDNAHLIGPIPQLVSEAVAFVRKNTKTSVTITDEGYRQDVPDYPLDVVREAVTNALMHRDYSPGSRGSQVQVNLYTDRLEIQNPGGLYGTVTISNLGEPGISDSRNQFLANILELTPYGSVGHVAENRGSGYQTMLEELKHASMPKPLPTNTLNYFRLTLYKKDHKTEAPTKRDISTTVPTDQLILDQLQQVESASARELADMTGITIRTIRNYLARLQREGRIEATEATNSPKQRYRLLSEHQ